MRAAALRRAIAITVERGAHDQWPEIIHDPARGITGIFCEGFDVTQQIAAQNALRQSEERLQSMDRKKDEFLAVLAHELRNPLAPILNAATLLQHASTDREHVTRFAQMIERQTQAMTVLLDDLLEVARISSGKILLKRKIATTPHK